MRRSLYPLLLAVGLLGGPLGLGVAHAQSADASDGPMIPPFQRSGGGQPIIPPVQRGGPLQRMVSPQAAIDLARADASNRSETAIDQIAVVSVQPTEWSDFRLGCPSPAPGLAFAQVLVPGFVVELDVAGTPMTYHTDGGLRAILCEPPAAPAPDPDE